MGVSTDAILFYGIAYGEDQLDMSEVAAFHGVDEEDIDFDNLYAHKAGVKHPDMEWSDDPAVKKVYKTYWTAIRDAVRAHECSVDHHCSAEYPLYYVCVKPSRYMAARGDAAVIPDGLSAQPEWREKLHTYCEFMGLPWAEPKWHLVSYWG